MGATKRGVDPITPPRTKASSFGHWTSTTWPKTNGSRQSLNSSRSPLTGVCVDCRLVPRQPHLDVKRDIERKCPRALT